MFCNPAEALPAEGSRTQNMLTKKTTFLFLLILIGLAGCKSPEPDPGISRITILYTNDEHGWMAGTGEANGAANLAGLWDAGDFGQDGHLLILSGGDNWTGPAVSTWFHGQGMVEVMNAIGYDAAAVGNHEFDFGLDILKTRISESTFPYLSANIRYENDGTLPLDLGILPYTILNLQDIKMGIIGLTTTETPNVTHPKNVAGLEFIDYRGPLEQFVPKMREEGAQVIILVSHICSNELARLAWQVKSLHIPIMTGAHCHERYAHRIGDTIILSGGSYFQSYALAQIDYDHKSGAVLERHYETRMNRGAPPDPQIAAIVQRWQEETDDQLDVSIAYLEKGIPRRSPLMGDLITYSWLHAYPQADAALTNPGGVRDSLPPGEITLAHIVDLLPFDNTLVAVKLDGEQLLKVVRHGNDPLIGGISREGARWVLDKTGEPLQGDNTYTVLVNDFMYAGGDSYHMLAEFDPNAYDTNTDWRDPLIDWIKDQRSSRQNPLDEKVASIRK